MTVEVKPKAKPRPKARSSLGNKELDKVEKQFEEFDTNVKQLTMDRMNEAPKEDVEPQTKMSSREIAKAKEIYLKPTKSIGSREKFNERFRECWNFDKEYVHFIAENRESPGDTIEIWTKPYPGVPAEFWTVPTNKPLYAPRHLAEQIKGRSYHRLVMEDNTITETNGIGKMYGGIAVDTIVNRLDAQPVSNRKSIFMGAF